jgi:uncharacterized protein (TIGR03083 family)
VDVESYDAVRARVDELVRGTEGAAAVPTCPSWRVRDVVAHLTGLCDDWVAGRLDGYGSDAWTAAQVARFDGAPVGVVLDRWSDAAIAFATLDDDPTMGPPARWAFGDAVTHEADLRGALDAGRVPADVVALALKAAIARWRQVLADAGAPTLLLRAPDLREWWLGEQGDAHAIVAEAEAYEVFRALAGRRSRAQVERWTWSRDPAPILDAGLPYPFRWSAQDIIEP